MNPLTQFCHNVDCEARGKTGQGTITIHSHKEQRYRCTSCGKTFAATSGTPFYRLKQTVDVVTIVLTLLCNGCPTQAIVAAFGLDERTVASWLLRAGTHAHSVHDHLIAQHPVDVQHVQADELWVKLVGRKLWQAMAIAVPSRLWLGGVISPKRDRFLIRALVRQVRVACTDPAILVCVDGLASYVTAFVNGFRRRVPQARGAPRLHEEQGLLMGQVVKHTRSRRLTGITRRVVRGSLEAIEQVIHRTGSGTSINTSYIERLNATYRSKLACLGRRTRNLARSEAMVRAGMWLVGGSYNLCWYHHALRLRAVRGAPLKWDEHTPAMAANLTDHCWTMHELLSYQVPLPPWVAPKRRGRPPKPKLELAS